MLNTVIAKLGSYHILANLIPGTFFGFALEFLFGITLPLGSIGEHIIAYYFIGLIIGRVSSLVTKRIFTRKKGTAKAIPTQFIEYTPYPEYIKAEASDPKITSLSDMNECYRALLTSIWMLPIVALRRHGYGFRDIGCGSCSYCSLFCFYGHIRSRLSLSENALRMRNINESTIWSL